MKVTKLLFLLLFVLVLFAGCAPYSPVGAGALFTNVTGPLEATSNSESTKIGKATCVNVLAIVAVGDCGIEAERAGGIKEVVSVDGTSTTVWYFFSSFTTIVRGN